MPTAATPGHLWVSWDDYHRAIEDLAYKVHQSGWAFDQVLCLARGGLRPGDVFSRLFNVPLAVLSTSSYREAGGTVRGELDISAHIASTAGPLAGNILLVDDLVDSGVTLQTVQAYLPMPSLVMSHRIGIRVSPEYSWAECWHQLQSHGFAK